MQTMHHEKGGLPDTSYDEISSLGSFVHEDDKPGAVERVKKYIEKTFPKVNFAKLGPVGFSKKGGNETTIVSLGTRGGETEIFKKDGRVLLKRFTEKFKIALGPNAESLIGQENEEIEETKQSLREAEKQLQEAEKLSSEREKLLKKCKI